nr:GGDEF domain-containing protein [Negativicutes bacterium]
LSGDECLKKVAKTASACIKRSCDLAARYGGEEFVFLLPNTNLDGAIKVAERLRQGIENLNIEHVKSPKNKITCSVGVATLIADKALLPTEILALADKNLYKAKDSGRNTIYYSV